MSARWIDVVDPTRDDVLSVLSVHVDPDVVETLASPAREGPEPRPLLESHGAYVFGVLMAAHALPNEDRVVYQEVDVVVTPELLVTVRKSVPGIGPFDPVSLHTASDVEIPAGNLVHRLFDDIVDSYLQSVEAVYAEIEELEDALEAWPPSRVRERITALRHELLRSRRNVSATRASIRRILDGRVEVGVHALFPRDVELLFSETSETLVRVTEELDIARDLLAGVRDHHQSTIAETQGDVVRKLTVVASLVLVPSLIVGFYGQNFEGAFDDGYWSLGVSVGLILASTVAQLALYRWRRWI